MITACGVLWVPYVFFFFCFSSPLGPVWPINYKTLSQKSKHNSSYICFLIINIIIKWLWYYHLLHIWVDGKAYYSLARSARDKLGSFYFPNKPSWLFSSLEITSEPLVSPNEPRINHVRCQDGHPDGPTRPIGHDTAVPVSCDVCISTLWCGHWPA